MQYRRRRPLSPEEIVEVSHVPSLPPYDAGVKARRDGTIRQPPDAYAFAESREWTRGYDDEQRRIDAAAQWMRDHAASVDEWGFV
jgi:hypothetical protein